MALTGIDISSWQAGIDVSAVPSDFVIIKATQGTAYVNPDMARTATATIKSGRGLGLYHFATVGDAVAQADHFLATVGDRVGSAVLVLDWEADAVTQGPGWALAWLDRVHEITGVKPLIYMSASVTGEHDWSAVVAADYGLWVAAYALGYAPISGYSVPDGPTGVRGWSSPAMWQFTSSGHLSGWGGALDMNVFYGDRAAWDAYAAATTTEGDTTKINIEKGIRYLLATCADPAVGYSQPNRTNPNSRDLDCSRFMQTYVRTCGSPITAGLVYTGNMHTMLPACGWRWHAGLAGIKRGDILWRSGHTAAYIGDGSRCEAWIDEVGGITGPREGDQTGQEVRQHRPWNDLTWDGYFVAPKSTPTPAPAPAHTPIPVTIDDLEEVISTMKATHIVFENAGRIGIANVLAGTYTFAPNPQALADRRTVLARSGAKVAEWKSLGARSNTIADLDALGTEVK